MAKKTELIELNKTNKQLCGKLDLLWWVQNLDNKIQSLTKNLKSLKKTLNQNLVKTLTQQHKLVVSIQKNRV